MNNPKVMKLVKGKQLSYNSVAALYAESYIAKTINLLNIQNL